MSSNLTWPTHRAKARDRRKKTSAAKHRRRALRRLEKTGKRGVIQEHV